MRGYTVCVDVGGTFVDLALFEGEVAVGFHKVLNVPSAPEQAALHGLRELLAATGTPAAALDDVIYATTLAVNAVVERRGAPTALLTTQGFRDALEIRTEQPYDLYNLFGPFPEPLVPRRLRLGVAERTLYDGTIARPPQRERVAEVAAALRRAGVASVAVCFLHSYANSASEEAVAGWLAEELPGVPASLSSRVLPEIGEYGRASTTVVNAYVLPLIGRHLARLDAGLRELGFGGRLLVVTSAGGMMGRQVAAELPVKLLESGPASGAVGVAALLEAKGAGDGDAVTFDMGGTTAKTSIVIDGRPLVTTEYEVGRVERFKRGSGLLVRMPTVDIVEVGAGGGSIAYVDAAGLLAVGPRSAGAEPGPACYGRGGDLPTVTDADLLLGLLNAAYFLGGTFPLDAELARRAVARHVATPLGLAVEEAAAGIFRVVNANMAQAVGVHAAEKGVNVQRCALVAIGGAGPVHACAVARQLGIRRVVVPDKAGVFSALGCRTVPPAFEHVTSYRALLDEVDLPRLDALYGRMEEHCLANLVGAAAPERVRFGYAVDVQYAGQRSYLTVPFAKPSSGFHRATLAAITRTFEEAYEVSYHRRIPGVPLEALSWRLRAEEPLPTRWPRLAAGAAGLLGRPAGAGGPGGPADQGRQGGSAPGDAPRTRAVYFPEHGFVAARVCRGRARLARERLAGPAVIEDEETTVVVPPGAVADVGDDLTVTIVL
ncbi:MAG: hydantoinase/oxoprolinase family protein [Chloroflexi bacterium]|nr:hydantoinase/oxoprolinase family protein [Chloroflexota bacterium]